VNRAALAVLRVVQFAYPASFRRRFGADLMQLARDRWWHGGVGVWRIVWTETCDAARAAPALRWESNMTRVVAVSVLAAVAIVAAMAVKLLLIPVVLIGFACWFSWGRAWRPVAATQPARRWVRWLVAGAATIALAIAIPAIDGGELNGFWWSAAALALLGGVSMVVAALLLASSARESTRAAGLG
jgi:hypothetical protein